MREVEKPERAGRDGVAHDCFHLRDVIGRRGLVARPALAHHVRAHRAVRYLRADVEEPRRLIEEVEVLGEALPSPPHALLERGAGDVFDALHQFDEPLAFAGSHRCEPDTAVAHDHSRDAVPARRRQVGIPRDLTVVVRVDVDEARCHEMTRGVDDLGRLRVAQRALVVDAGDEPVAHRDVGVARVAATAVDQGRVGNHQVVVGRGHGRLRGASGRAVVSGYALRVCAELGPQVLPQRAMYA